MKKYILILTITLSLPKLYSQDAWDSFTEAYTGRNSSGYVGPLVDIFTNNLNAGVFASSNSREGFHFELSVKGMLGLVPTNLTTFNATTESPFTPIQTVEAPTIFGPAESVTVEGDNGTGYIFPAGFDVDYFPMAVPQLRVGNLYGTDIMVRYFGLSLEETVDDLSLFGIGIRHNFGRYIPGQMLDVNLSYTFQQFELGTIINASTSLIQLQVGQTLGIFNYYGVAGYQNGNFDLKYTYESTDGDLDIDLNLETENALKLGVGAAVKLFVFHLNAEYVFSSPNVFAAGIGLGI